MDLFMRWRTFLDDLHAHGRYRQLALPSGVDFSSNDYLGYGKTPPRSADLGPLSRSGQASRLLRGQHAIWEQVEDGLARWHGAEAALMMTSGYTANEGLLSTLLQPGDFLASDQCNHASIIDGARLGKGERFIFRHNDLNHLEEGLRQAAQQRSAGTELFIITEALFGMETDRAPLAEMAALAEQYQAHLIVDEAHTTGCFDGCPSLAPRANSPSLALRANKAEGSGLVDALGLRQRVLATVHTGGKALGVFGAYICGSHMLREVLLNRCRHLIFTTALPPMAAAWWLEALDRVRADGPARQALHEGARFFRAELAQHGILAQGHDYIVPVLLGEDGRALQAAEKLRLAGFDIRAIRPPTVAEGTARLRISIHADHSKDELRRAAQAVASAIAE